MKNTKRFAGILLAVVLVFAMMVPAFAAQTADLTIKNTVAGKQYDLYRVFDLTHSGDSGEDGNYYYSVNPAFAAYFSGKNLTVEDIRDLDAGELSELAQDILGWAIANEVAPAKSVTGTADNTVVSGLDYGYYLLNPLGGSIPKTGYATMFSLNTLSGGDNEIVLKAEYPTIDKTFADETIINNVSVGDEIGFVLTSKVPDMTGYNRYYFVINDTMSKGLTFEQIDSVKVGDTVLTSDDYNLEEVTNQDGSTSLRIIFKNFLQYIEQTGDAVVVTYTATLNDEAEIGEDANVNEAFLQYSNDPKYDYDGNKDPKDPEDPQDPGDPDDPNKDPNAPIGETEKSKTETFTTSLTINKVDGEGNILTGAAFRITGDMVNQVITTGDVYVENEDGTYYKLKDRTYTATAPDGTNGDAYESTTVKYTKETKTTLETQGTTPVAAEAFVDATGKLTFAGLSAGTYTITEIVTPNGYNPIDPIQVVITFDPVNKIFSATVGQESIDNTGNVLSMDVVNETGTTLPSTGGIGTTIFYVMGGVLVLGAVVLLITKKRMSNTAKSIVD